MNTDVKKAVDKFCQIFPPAKIGDYSHATDIKRLLEIAYQAYLSEENVSGKDFEEALSTARPDIAPESIKECAEDCRKIVSDMKEIVKYLDEKGYLVK